VIEQRQSRFPSKLTSTPSITNQKQAMPQTQVPTQSADTATIEKNAYAKVFLRVVPFLMICYVVAYLDRINVGFAKLQMEIDLGFSQTAYGLGAGMFFIGYFFFEVPSNMIMYRVGARLWIARIMITWGTALGALRLRENAILVLYAPVPAGSGGGRFLPWRYPLSNLLVSRPPASCNCCNIHAGDSRRRHLWESTFRLDHGQL